MRRLVLVVALVGPVLLACGGAASTADAGDAGGGLLTDGGPVSADAGRDASVSDAGEPGDAGPGLPRWANTQWPPWATVTDGGAFTAYGRVWVEGRTEGDGAAAGLVAELGVGPEGSDPSSASWRWVPGAFNVQSGNNDEFQATLTPPGPGTWDVAWRFRLPGAFSGWLLGDRADGARKGSDDGYQSLNAAKVVVPVPGAELGLFTLNLHCVNGDVAARLDAVAARVGALQPAFVALQEACVTGGTNTAALLASRLGAGWTSGFVETHVANGTTQEGVGFVARVPVLDSFPVDLPLADFPRKAVMAVLATPAGIVAAASSHVSYRPQDASARADQNRTLRDSLAGLTPAIARQVVLGDFNAGPTEASLDVWRQAGFVDAWASAHPADMGLTFPSSAPTERIDYVWAKGGWTVVGATKEFTGPFRAQEYVSDHCGVSTVLRLQ